MKYEIIYKIISGFSTQIEADSEEEAEAKFREIDMRHEVSDNILDGGLDHSEVKVEDIKRQYREVD